MAKNMIRTDIIEGKVQIVYVLNGLNEETH